MNAGIAISCAGISKRFRIPNAQYSTLKGRVLHPFTRTTFSEFQALEDVSFEVRRGEFFGIVGRNGSGKSTLLKLIAGIYRADAGRLEIDGSIAPFIELGVGFNDELSGRENLFLNGALLGLTRTELERRYVSIVKFAELEEFMELKLRNFSSGMQVRLAFSIALQAGADILLTDEVLAVGDERFQRKCFDVFREQKRKGQTVVFVSHDMGAVGQFCDRGLLLEQGRVVTTGPIHEVVREYHRINNEEPAAAHGPPGSTRITEITVTDEHGLEQQEFQSGAPISMRFRLQFADRIEDPIVGMSLRDRYGYRIWGTNTELAGAPTGSFEAGDDATVVVTFSAPLATGHYNVSASVAWPRPGDVLDWKPEAIGFDVRSDRDVGGVVEIEHSVAIER